MTDPRKLITVVTATVPSRTELLDECMRSVFEAGLEQIVEIDVRGDGPAEVRNRGMAKVETPWAVFLDDDDLLYPHYADAVGKHFQVADLIYTGWDLVGADQPQPVPFDPYVELTTNLIPVTACVRTTMFRELGGFDPSAPLEDHDLWKRVSLAWDEGRGKPAYRIVFEPTVCWQYRRLPGSRTEELL